MELPATLDHVADALVLYAAHLATRATGPLPPGRNGGPACPPAKLIEVVGAAATLAEVARAAPAGVRAHHPAGMVDAEGFVAMGCEEILIHADDVARGLGRRFRPLEDLAERVLRPPFPWAPAERDPWPALRWACGRAALPARERLGPDWY